LLTPRADFKIIRAMASTTNETIVGYTERKIKMILCRHFAVALYVRPTNAILVTRSLHKANDGPFIGSAVVLLDSDDESELS
jgi:hypothetical protein